MCITDHLCRHFWSSLSQLSMYAISANFYQILQKQKFTKVSTGLLTTRFVPKYKISSKESFNVSTLCSRVLVLEPITEEKCMYFRMKPIKTFSKQLNIEISKIRSILIHSVSSSRQIPPYTSPL